MSLLDSISFAVDFVIEATPVRHIAVPLLDAVQVVLGGGDEPSWYSSNESDGMRAGRVVQPFVDLVVEKVPPWDVPKR